MTHKLGPLPARWYSVSVEGLATLCRDEEDARWNATYCDQAWPRGAPHRAVQLVEAAGVARAVAAERAKWSNLTPVIQWLENGCDPKEAAKELRFYQTKATRGAQAHGQTP